MQIHKQDIITPVDDPIQYDAEWRHKTAVSLLGSHRSVDSLYVDVVEDPYVLLHREYLKASRNGSGLPYDMRNNHIAHGWFSKPSNLDIRARIEPLLLTGAPYESIALDIGGGDIDSDVIKIYERLYFPVRDKDGALHKSCWLRTRFTNEGVGSPNDLKDSPRLWKLVASQLGYKAIVFMWMWEGNWQTKKGLNFLSEAWRAAQSLMLSRLMSQSVRDFDLNNFLGRYTDHERMKHDTAGKDDQRYAPLVEQFNQVLSLVSPEVYNNAKDVDYMDDIAKDLQAKLISVKGKEGIGEKALGDLIKKQLK